MPRDADTRVCSSAKQMRERKESGSTASHREPENVLKPYHWPIIWKWADNVLTMERTIFNSAWEKNIRHCCHGRAPLSAFLLEITYLPLHSRKSIYYARIRGKSGIMDTFSYLQQRLATNSAICFVYRLFKTERTTLFQLLLIISIINAINLLIF